ncbi:MAG TPA: nuclear transport factor 2 family protein [Candidatus Dormibacteraeota bacterium]
MNQTTLPEATSEARRTALPVVRAFFDAMAKRDLNTVASLFSDDATWNHRNQDRWAGVHQGRRAILDFIGESVQLTGGTLRPVPLAFLPDGDRLVAVLVRLEGSRPDGRSSNDMQMVLYAVDDGRISAVDHFVGDPAAITAFWA